MTTTTPTPDSHRPDSHRPDSHRPEGSRPEGSRSGGSRTDTRAMPRVPSGADRSADGTAGHAPDGDRGRPGRGRRSRRTVVAASALGVLALGGAATGIVLATSGSSSPSPAHPVAAAAPSPVAEAPSQPVAPEHAPTPGSAAVPPGTHSVVPRPPAPPAPPAPSAAVEALQRELGQLNYYEGPVTGVVDARTTAAITYLQRDAHLPQTGTMDAATQQALANFLAHGNNQMGG